MVKILHLSDLHFCKDAQASNMKNIILDEARIVHDLPLGEKLLIITGDFHNFSASNYSEAEKFIKSLIEAMNIDLAQDVFIIPGNHDVGNDELLSDIPGAKKLSVAAVKMLKDGDMSYIDWRLRVFAPFCQFARRIGVYSGDDELLPAKVHVRRWRNRLNILHLNTALVADGGKEKDNQMVDVDTAASDEVWDGWYDDHIPALALGHNSFFDLMENQQLSLTTMFVKRNVSAYLCGDTHKANFNIRAQRIPLEFGMNNHPLLIPNIVCVKGISENADHYSDFGYYWHEWDEKTAHVNISYQRWNPEYLARTIRDEAGSGFYDMRTKGEMPDLSTPDRLPETGLKKALADMLIRARDNHPSFVLLKNDGIDPRQFPRAAEEKTFEALGKTDKSEAVSPVWSIIRASWKKDKKHNIVIEGDGGIGKTITLFSVAESTDDTVPPAIYVPMHRLVDEAGNCLSLSDYLVGLSPIHGKEILTLAAGGWVKGPKLLLLLDGFNEVPAGKRRKILGKINDWNDCSGTQLIAVSRPMDTINLKAELADDPIAITLQPLSREVVRDYLGDKTPPDTSHLWNVLTRPLFLNLYVKTADLEGKLSSGYRLSPKKAVSGGSLIWNYLQRELLKNPTEAWVLRCTFACEYILPYIAFRMEQEHRFTLGLKQLKVLIEEAVKSIDFEKLPHHLSDLSKQYEERHFAVPDLSSVDWNNTVFYDVGLLKKDKYDFAFIHQHFRDALAGLYLVNQAEMMQDGEALPEVWRRAANYDVMNYAAELMEEPEAARLWETNRLTRPTDSSATYAMLELQMRRSDGTDSNLNFSGMDLREISLVRYMCEHTQGEKDMKLFRRQELSICTQLDEGTFLGRGHTSTVRCIVVAEDGLCVSGSSDNTLRVWDLRNGECLRTLEGHTDSVECVAVAEDGLCVSGSWDHTLRVWDLLNGECLRTLEGHTDDVSCIAVAEDGLCVSGSMDNTLRVWDLYNGECLRTLEGHTDDVSCIAVAEDGLCVSGSMDNTLRVWDLRTGVCLRTLEGHTYGVICIAVAEEGLCVSGSGDYTLRVWDLRTGECLRTLEGHTSTVNCIAVAEDGLCVSGSGDNTLHVWNLHTGVCLRTLEGHTDYVECVAVAEDGLCVSGSWDNTLRVWNLLTGECLRTLEGHTSTVNCIAVAEDGLCVSGSVDNTLRVWNLRIGVCLRTLEGHTDWVRCIAMAEDGLCVSGSGDNTLRVWNLNTGECLRTLEGHTGPVNYVAVAEEGLCVSGSYDNTLRVWDLRTGKCLRTLEGHTGPVSCVVVAEDGLCVSGSLDNTLRVWDLRTGVCLRTLEEHTSLVSCIAVAEDGLCISGSWDEDLRVWDLRTGVCLRTLEGHTGPVNYVAVAEEGLCVSGSGDYTLRVWDLRTGVCLRTLEGHTGLVSCVAVAEEGLCVSGSSDNTLRVWDLRTGVCLRTLEGHTDWVGCIAMAEDGLCVSGSGDNTLRVWDLNTAECLNTLEGHTSLVSSIAVAEDGLCISGSWDETLRVWDIHTGECLDIWHTMETDVSRMDFSMADLASPVLSKTLWQHRAKVPKEDSEKYARRRIDEK